MAPPSVSDINLSSSRQLCLYLFILASLLSAGIATGQRNGRGGGGMNVIDRCWRRNPNWAAHRQQLAKCSIGFAGKMRNNIGKDVTRYTVTDSSDDPLNPRPGTLRYGTTMVRGKVWIKFQTSMQIKLQKPLLIKSFTTIDGRGVDVHIAYGAGIVLYEVNNVIIHGLQFHDCQVQPPSSVMGPGGKIMQLGQLDGDAIRLVGSSKIWIDHNTFYQCQDGLLDVTRGSTGITISNNWFRNHDKVMLLGHDDNFVQDRKMQVTVVFNRFGPGVNQRMPRIRHGYAHIVNNLYDGWGDYAIGGSMNPSIMSEANLFIAPNTGKKAITWREAGGGLGASWKWRSVNDLFQNGALFHQTGNGVVRPAYNRQQIFRPGNANSVRSLTSNAGTLRCSSRSRC